MWCQIFYKISHKLAQCLMTHALMLRRVCSERSFFQFPEVKIGIIPGALGTQLLPRLTSFETALAMCVGCKMLSAKEALQTGVVDQIIPLNSDRSGDFEERMVRVLENQILRGDQAPHPFRKTR